MGSSLTAVDLSGLTTVELGFALALAVAATGLLLVLGFAERRRTFALAAVLGARPRQVGAFIWAEVVLTGVMAAVFGAVSGRALSRMLVAVLSGVFDPPTGWRCPGPIWAPFRRWVSPRCSCREPPCVPPAVHP
ncbi:FtsX-like permease family protein [Microbispora rosea]|uniref:FtsX-like permease family protein n=1 Tax=Microbispora rosea TaxID=58117 RepID=UPI0004C36BB0|nr:ABC transporter permease [Microbispora rosea]